LGREAKAEGKAEGVGKDEAVEKEEEKKDGRKWVPRSVGEWMSGRVRA
jgi:hypothetical protein